MNYNVKLSEEALSPRVIALLSIAAGCASLLLFCLTLSPTAFPGESASLMAVRLGIEPRLTPDNPLWLACSTVWQRLPFGSAVYVLNLWSAVCGALAVGLLCRFMAGWIGSSIKIVDAELNERQAGQAAMLAGGTAALALATSIPFWAASTRLNVLSFHTVLLLLAFNLVQDYRSRGGEWRPYALALLCGAGCAETVLFLVMTPCFAVMLLIAMYQREAIPWRRGFGLTLTGLIGAGLYGVAAYQFAGSGGFELRGYTGRSTVVWQMFIDQLHQLQLMLPRVGWLWVVVFVFVPWLAVQFEAPHGLNKRRAVPATYFHIVLVIMALLVQSNASFLPWSASLPSGRLPVLELLLTAMLIGYLVAFWFLRFVDPALRLDALKDQDSESGAKDDEQFLIRGLTFAMGTALVLVTAFAAFKNGACASGLRGAFADAYVKEVLEQMQGRKWLVTDGLLDAKLRIAAIDRGQTLNLVDLSSERNPIQIRRLRHAITEDPVFAEHAATLRNAASLGGAAFLREWFASGTGAVNRVAFYAPPDLLLEAGFMPQPDRLLFAAAQDPSALKPRPLLDEHEPFWTRMEQVLKGPAQGDPIDTLRGALRRHVSLAANNLGVLLEDLGRPEEAYAAYRRALAIDPDNFSAMLNRVVLTRHGVKEDDKAEAESKATKALEKLARMPDSGRLARYYGYVRVPAEFSKQSAEWMRYGQPKMATALLRRAIDLSPEDQKLQLLQGLATIQFADGKPAESEALLQSVLAKTPLDSRALLGMVHSALGKKDIAAARDWLEQVRLAGVPDDTLLLESAAIDVAAGDAASARRKLQELTDRDPRQMQAWALQAGLLIAQGKIAEAETSVLHRMKAAAGNVPQYLTALTEGFILKAKGPASFKAAREAFLLALNLNPGSRMVLTEVLRLDYALMDAAATEVHAGDLLRLDCDDALANYLMGTLLAGRNDLEGAEAHLRRCVAAAPSATGWNDLAETLRLLKKLPEAEEAARQALKLNPKNAFAYDTLSCVLLDSGRLQEAKQATDAARALDPKAVPLMLTEARIVARSGNQAEASERVNKIASLGDSLTPRQRAELAAVEAEIRKP